MNFGSIFKREPYSSVLCITGFVILNSDKAVMTTLGHTLSLSMSPDHVSANKAHEPMLAQCRATVC